jgi:hypothetical protein
MRTSPDAVQFRQGTAGVGRPHGAVRPPRSTCPGARHFFQVRKGADRGPID